MSTSRRGFFSTLAGCAAAAVAPVAGPAALRFADLMPAMWSMTAMSGESGPEAIMPLASTQIAIGSAAFLEPLRARGKVACFTVDEAIKSNSDAVQEVLAKYRSACDGHSLRGFIAPTPTALASVGDA